VIDAWIAEFSAQVYRKARLEEGGGGVIKEGSTCRPGELCFRLWPTCRMETGMGSWHDLSANLYGMNHELLRAG
jgi:hypothetical protein